MSCYTAATPGNATARPPAARSSACSARRGWHHRTCPPGSGGDVFIAPADGDEEFWSAWHARHPQPAPPAASIASDAENFGRDAGRAAASWMFDGNTPEDTYRAVLRGIEEGDPAILDAYPPPACPPTAGTPKPAWPATSAWTTKANSRRTP